MTSSLNTIIVSLPRSRGSYALFLRLPSPISLTIGHLGKAKFPPGRYVYCGSALGPGGLRARVGRHIHGNGKAHWHIDYLQPHTQIEGFCHALLPSHQSTTVTRRLECRWSQALAELPYAHIPLPRFGASDCHSGCTAHLIAFPENHSFDKIGLILAAVCDQHSESLTFSAAFC